jgi:hypothetical protein
MKFATVSFSKREMELIMATVTFDKLVYLETLKAAGIPDGQARAHVQALEDALRDSVATKADIVHLESSLRELEQRLTIKMGTMAVALAAFLAAIKYWG